jgi:hypothetical protein
VSNTRTKPKQQEDTPCEGASLNCFSLYKKFGHFAGRETIKTQYFIKRTGISFTVFRLFNQLFFDWKYDFQKYKKFVCKMFFEKIFGNKY